MGSAACFWHKIIFAIMLLADLKSCFNISYVTGMRSHQVDMKLSKTKSKFWHLESSFIHDAASNERRLAVSPGEGSSKREVEALIAFKDSVTSDPLGALQGWMANDSDACGWTGVKCSALSKNIADLDLKNLGLVGIVPQLIGSLSYVKFIDLSNNFLSGSIPDSIANCSNLSYLNISYNQITGEIPVQIGKLSHLLALDATQNNLTGQIPEAIGNCSMLEIVNLGYNILEGAIPLTVGKLSSLEKLGLQYNILSGTIPSTLGNCTRLASLTLSYNFQLGGEFPEELSMLKKMQIFYASYCNFVGTFPTWVTNFTSLAALQLAGIPLSGHIPEEIGKLSENLTVLVLVGDQFTGPIPQAIVNCSGLVWLELAKNQLTGNIPDDIGFLINLELLTLFANNISGVIPPSTSNCSALIALELGFNPMSRQMIPSWIASLESMEYIYLPEMNLYGEIPSSWGQLSNLVDLDIYHNYLGGAIPAFVGNLTGLYGLGFQFNQLQGEIPAEITGNLTSLIFLRLSGNFFVGSLPDFSNLNELTILLVQDNLLTGTIDSSIGVGTPLLKTFKLDGNSISGHLPDGIGNLSNLQSFSLSQNVFSGFLPPSLGNLTSLGYMNAESNYFEGLIPADLASCTQLVFIDYSHNNFKGLIPHEIGQLVNLEELYFYDNKLSGSLLSSFTNFTKLGILYLGYNRFSGVISGGTLSKMTALTQVDISHNFISGSLPPELYRLTNLQYLDLSVNNISGSIVPGIAACIGLAYLDVSLNNFTGTIPPDLGLLQHLQFFNASSNNFDGPIPTSGLFLTQNINKSSFLDNPGLCGSTRFVNQNCPNLSVSAEHHHCKTFKCRRIWIPVVVSISAFLFLGIMMIMMCWRVLAGHEKTGQYTINEITLQGRIVLSEKDLMTIIEGEDNVIGTGAKSVVYKGELPGGEIFALKVLQNEDTDSTGDMDKTEELLREVHTLAQLRHVNIVKVLGVCVTPNVKALILEYLPRGSLHDILHKDGEVCKLSHQERFMIILGIAESLVYLHHSFHEPIIHRDLKPSNILLGRDLEPKLGDFGISKFARFQTEGDFEASVSAICGTFGYMPPEYASQSTVSTKGDVYAFGVVLLELLTGRKPAAESSSFASGDLVEFVRESFKEKPFELLDITLMEEGRVNPTSKEQLMRLLWVGVLCTRPTPQSRPNMSDVLGMLKQIQDVGTETKTLKSVEELANEMTVWDPDSAQQPNDQVTSSS